MRTSIEGVPSGGTVPGRGSARVKKTLFSRGWENSQMGRAWQESRYLEVSVFDLIQALVVLRRKCNNGLPVILLGRQVQWYGGWNFF